MAQFVEGTLSAYWQAKQLSATDRFHACVGGQFPVIPGRVSCSIRDTACIRQPCGPHRNVRENPILQMGIRMEAGEWVQGRWS